MKRIFKKIKKVLGLELPYLLEEENIKEVIELKNKKDNIVAIPKNVEVKIYENTELEKQIMLLSNCVTNSGITMNEARELLAKIGEINENR